MTSRKKLNILMVTSFFPPDIGGLPIHVLNLSRNLAKLGANITLITPKRQNVIEEDRNHFSKIYFLNSFNFPGWPYRSLKKFYIPTDFGSKIQSIIRNGDFHIIHVHGHHYPFSWYALKSASKFGIPSILTLHGMYALNPNKEGGKPIVEELFNKYYFKKILSHSKAIIGLTKTVTNYARTFANPSLKYFTIPNGVNVDLFKDNIENKNEFRRNFNVDTNSIVILFLGRFEQVKGIIEFSNAVKNILKNKQVEVLIVGRGLLENKVKSIFKGIKRVHIFPWQPAKEIHKFYIASDIFVIPSTFEGLPLTLIEAMNAGLHIVYTQAGGIPDIVEGYSRKTFLKHVTSEDIQNVLNEVIARNSLKEGLNEALNYARKFNWYDLAQETIKAYNECQNHKK